VIAFERGFGVVGGDEFSVRELNSGRIAAVAHLAAGKTNGSAPGFAIVAAEFCTDAMLPGNANAVTQQQALVRQTREVAVDFIACGDLERCAPSGTIVIASEAPGTPAFGLG